MPKEVCGALSTFGEQILSAKQTFPRPKFGTSGRTDKIYDKSIERTLLGRTSPGANCDVASGFGAQKSSTNTNAPAFKMAAKLSDDPSMTNRTIPGPGAYGATEAVGKQALSQNCNVPTWRFGSGQRWGHYKVGFKDTYATPAGGDPRLSAGWIGDAPSYSFHGKGQRSDVAVGLVGQKPTPMEDPGPGAYNETSMFGSQADARKTTAPRVKVGRENRDAIMKMVISPGHEKVLYARNTPSPNTYNVSSSVGAQVVSKRRSPSNFKFGSSDRFSDIKPRTPKTMSLPSTPGPGTYVV